MIKLPFRQVHLDFHTSEKIDGIGSQFDKKQFQNALIEGHVNSITIFSKCHHGWAYHPSKANIMHPGLKFDLLGEMLSACSEIGVHAPVYLSAGFDEKYAKVHPEHLHVWGYNDPPCNFDASPTYHVLCMNTPYLDVLCEQVREVIRIYNPEGIFLDIVAPRACYCEYCKAQRKKEGFDPSDSKAAWEHGERTYKKYYEAINKAATEINPDIKIFHNGGHITAGRRDLAHANTHLELESLPTGGWGYDHFPKSARYVQNLGMEYLGMTGKFHLSWGEFGGYKHKNALRYEVALSMANGAKSSIGDQMHPYGFLDDATYKLIGAAYAEAEQKEEYCDDVENVADIGVLSVEAAGITAERTSRADVGAARILLEGKYLFDYLDLDCDFSKYKVIILPDLIRLDGKIKDKISEYVNNGGKLLCSGNSGLSSKDEFVFDFGVKYEGECEFNPSYLRPVEPLGDLNVAAYIIYASAKKVSLTDKNAKILAMHQNPFFNRTSEHFSSHQHAPNDLIDTFAGVVVGKNGAYIAWDIFSEYSAIGSIISKEIVKLTLDNLLSDEKTLETNLPAQGITTLMYQKEHNRFVNHLLYATPVKRGEGVEIIEDLLPIYDTNVKIKLPKKCKEVYLAPQKEALSFIYNNGYIEFNVPKFECHQMIIMQI